MAHSRALQNRLTQKANIHKYHRSTTPFNEGNPMSWFYVRDNQSDGPHSDEVMQNLVRTGAINAQTPIWREGMPEWQPLAQAAPQFLGGATPPSLSIARSLEASCRECGQVFPVSQMVQIRDAKVCAACKPIYLQRIQEGVAPAGRAADLTRLLQIAKAQRGVNIGILLAIVGYVMLGMSGGLTSSTGDPPSGARAGLLIMSALGLLVVAGFQVVFVYRLASALKCGPPILWVLGMFLSCIGLIILLVLSSKATKELRAAGFKVGLLGGSPREIQAAMGR